MAEHGATIYVTAAELRALHDAGGYLSSLIEQTFEPPVDLQSAHEGLHSLIAKVSVGKRAVSKRNKIRKAVRIAERMLAAEG